MSANPHYQLITCCSNFLNTIQLCSAALNLPSPTFNNTEVQLCGCAQGQSFYNDVSNCYACLEGTSSNADSVQQSCSGINKGIALQDFKAPADVNLISHLQGLNAHAGVYLVSDLQTSSSPIGTLAVQTLPSPTSILTVQTLPPPTGSLSVQSWLGHSAPTPTPTPTPTSTLSLTLTSTLTSTPALTPTSTSNPSSSRRNAILPFFWIVFSILVSTIATSAI